MPPRPLRPLLVAAALVAALLGLVLLRDGPPTPRPASAPPEVFSAQRADAMLRYLFAEGDPHPVGSAAAARVRERLLRALQQLGLQPTVQEAWGCRDGGCAKVRNLLGRLPAAGPAGAPADGKAVLLMTHYDSVGAGPGVSDAGTSVAAALEVARALRAGPAPARPILLLLTEGEESGLLGAQAFADQHLAAREVGAVVNLDARGTGGPSLMFETSGDSGWLAALVAAALPRPRTSSLFVSIYERMPNDTDLTVLREARVPGVNFAFIGHVVHYHTPLDDLRHADLGTLQHQGENALAMTRALAAADLAAPPPGRAVFFDVLGLFVLRWPEPLTLPLAVLALLCAGAALGLLRRRGLVSGAAVLAGLGAALLAVAVTAGLGLGLGWGARATGAMPRPWVAHPLPVLLAFALAAAPGPLLATAALGRRAGAAGLFGGVALLFCALGLAVALLLPGAAHLALGPALCAAAAGLAWALRSAKSGGDDAAGAPLLPAALPAAAAALLELPVAASIYEAMGLPLLPAVPLLGALCLLWLAPLSAALPRRPLSALGLLCAGLSLLALGAGALVPTASAEAPERLPLTFYQEDGAARWIAQPQSGALPLALRGAAPFSPLSAATPFFRRGQQAPAPPLTQPPPELEVLSQAPAGDGRTVRLRLRSPRGATTLGLHAAPGAGLRSARVEGLAAPFRGWPGVLCHTVPRGGVEVELTLPQGEIELVLSDHTAGLPPAGAELLSARPAAAVTSHQGDTTILARRLRL